MAKLTSKNRNKLPASSFGMPGERKFPMPDKSHAANAKARATQAERSGRISKSTESTIDTKADRKLGEHSNVRNAASHMGKLKHC